MVPLHNVALYSCELRILGRGLSVGKGKSCAASSVWPLVGGPIARRRADDAPHTARSGHHTSDRPAEAGTATDRELELIIVLDPATVGCSRPRWCTHTGAGQSRPRRLPCSGRACTGRIVCKPPRRRPFSCSQVRTRTNPVCSPHRRTVPDSIGTSGVPTFASPFWPASSLAEVGPLSCAS